MDNSVQTEIWEIKMEILKDTKNALLTALKEKDSAMVAAIAEILKQY